MLGALQDGPLRDENFYDFNSKPGLIVDLLHRFQVIFACMSPEQTRSNKPEHRVFSHDSSKFNWHSSTMNVLYFWSFISEYLLPSMITTEPSSIFDKRVFSWWEIAAKNKINFDNNILIFLSDKRFLFCVRLLTFHMISLQY